MSVSIIVAYDNNRVIGHNNMLPWRLPEDMRLFKERTLDTTVIMGRKTWESLRNGPKKLWWLPQRQNIVISRNSTELSKQFWEGRDSTEALPPIWFLSLEHALRMYEIAKTSDDPKISTWNVIGGETIYNEFLKANIVDRVVASEVPGEHEGDAFFPILDPAWTIDRRRDYTGFSVVEYIDSRKSS